MQDIIALPLCSSVAEAPFTKYYFTTFSGIARRHELLYPSGMSYQTIDESSLQAYFGEPFNKCLLIGETWWQPTLGLQHYFVPGDAKFSGQPSSYLFAVCLFVLYPVMSHVYQKNNSYINFNLYLC